jgi:hypothetical protein
VTIKASSDPVVEQGMAEGLRILARIIATAHRRRVAEAGGNQRQSESSRSRKAKREESSEHKR